MSKCDFQFSMFSIFLAEHFLCIKQGGVLGGRSAPQQGKSYKAYNGLTSAGVSAAAGACVDRRSMKGSATSGGHQPFTPAPWVKTWPLGPTLVAQWLHLGPSIGPRAPPWAPRMAHGCPPLGSQWDPLYLLPYTLLWGAPHPPDPPGLKIYEMLNFKPWGPWGPRGNFSSPRGPQGEFNCPRGAQGELILILGPKIEK